MEVLCAPEVLGSTAGKVGEHPLSYPVALDAVQELTEVSQGIVFSDSCF